MTHQEKLQKSLKFRLMRKIWIKSKDISQWAGKYIIKWSNEADILDYKK